jgi:hypothetical protein
MFNIQPASEAGIDLSKANGVILYEGPSKLDGAPIVVIAVGIRKNSTNSKTGAMIQTYIIRSDMDPISAVKSGADSAICGNCVHRGNEDLGIGRSCYVTLIHGPRSVYASYKRGIYPRASAFEAAALFAGRMVRLGTYGDPAAAPYAMWTVALGKASGWTGYTHQWRAIDTRWASLVMASADSVDDMSEAHAKGYRTFRVSPKGEGNLKGLEISCPASEEMGKVTDCLSCKACMGTSAKARVSVQIAAHGAGKKHVR